MARETRHHGSGTGGSVKTQLTRRLGALVAALVVAAVAWLSGGTLPGQTNSPAQTGSASISAPATQRDLAPTSWDAELYPDYYRVAGAAVVDEEIQPGEVRYAPLDSLGRAGRAVACVTYDLMEEGSSREREDMRDLHPSGWGHNQEVSIPMPSGKAYRGALFNRSHLLAKSLGGEEILENLVTGTRTQNVGDNRDNDGGMAYTEGLARDWLRDHPEGTVYYAATPVYEGDELLPRSVFVDVLSSDGSLDLEVEVYNAARGFLIDYETGEFTES